MTYTKEDVRKYNLIIYSTGKPNEWYVRLYLGNGESGDIKHGMSVSQIFKTKEEAERRADKLADYLAPVIMEANKINF